MAVVHYHTGRFPPDERFDWPKLIPFIGPAAAAVARYDGILAAIPHPSALLAPLTTHEAVLSSRIEGTQATMEEVLEFEAGQEPDSPARRDDIQEVLNYRATVRRAEEMVKKLPLCQRLIRETHSLLMAGVRREGKSPGEYRKTPSWIGPPGCAMEEATFVSVGADKLPDAMSAWEHYIHRNAPDLLVKLAVLHAEFEALHPFLDGNGRLGRILIPLFLWRRGLTRQPMFYISAYFEAHRDAYDDALLAVSRDDDWTGWCLYFLEAVRAQAEENLAKTQGIIDLYKSMKDQLADQTRSRYVIQAVDWIFERPIFSSSNFVATADIPGPTARRFLKVLCEGQILRALSPDRGRRIGMLVFPELLNVVEGDSVF